MGVKEKGGYLSFLNSCVPSIVAAYWYPFAISWVASSRLVAVLTVYSSSVDGWLGSVFGVCGFGVFTSG